MLRRLAIIGLAGLASLATLGFAGSALADHPGGGGTPLSATLTGANECKLVSGAVVCGVGSATGTGTAELRLNSGQEEICAVLSVSGLEAGERSVGAHIHPGAAGQIGGVLVPLPTPTSGSSSGCVPADRETIKAIRANPSAYYVNVHSLPSFGPGAVRGQLSGPGGS